MQRILRVALALILALLAVPMSVAEPASATDAEFVIDAFPHDSGAVTIRDNWGERRPGGRRHQGIDIISPRGTPVVTVQAGTVIAMGWSRLSGYNLKIQHRAGWVSSYLHLNNDTPGTDDGLGGEETAFAPGLDVGDHVDAGQLIGRVGDSGNAEHTTPHTHFELKRGTEKVNPYPYLVMAWRRTGRDANKLAPMTIGRVAI
ncbi:MAG: M23 family metallopeptidase [Acidobacteria bacterium]|nr:M23 family metallopeptidase [Acidobacteriota bacterium]